MRCVFEPQPAFLQNHRKINASRTSHQNRGSATALCSLRESWPSADSASRGVSSANRFYASRPTTCAPADGGAFILPSVGRWVSAPFPCRCDIPIGAILNQSNAQVAALRAMIAWRAAAGPPQVRQGSRSARPAPPAHGLDRPAAARLFCVQAVMASRERDRSRCDSDAEATA